MPRANAECKEKCRSLPGSRFGPDAASMPLNDSVGGSQTDAIALEFFLAMETLKSRKEFFGTLHGETCAVIAHERHKLAIDSRLPHFDDRGRPDPGIFDRVP